MKEFSVRLKSIKEVFEPLSNCLNIFYRRPVILIQGNKILRRKLLVTQDQSSLESQLLIPSGGMVSAHAINTLSIELGPVLEAHLHHLGFYDLS